MGGLKKFDVQVCVLSGRSLPKLMPILAYRQKRVFLPVVDPIRVTDVIITKTL